jgi:hypothetical protein
MRSRHLRAVLAQIVARIDPFRRNALTPIWRRVHHWARAGAAGIEQ